MSIRKDNILGFVWDDILQHSLIPFAPHRALLIYRQEMVSFVWDAAKLENNPVTFIEVKTLLDGITIGGRKLSDCEQVTNLIDSSNRLIELVREGRFDLNKSTVLQLHGIVARNEALEWGVFRGEGDEKLYTPFVNLGEHGEYRPLPTEDTMTMNTIFHQGIEQIKTLPPYEGAMVMFLFCALQQFFFDGNKRTGRHMMNGWLMKHGFSPISIPASRAQEFNDKMVRFYVSKDATEMLLFLDRCRKNDFI